MLESFEVFHHFPLCYRRASNISRTCFRLFNLRCFCDIDGLSRVGSLFFGDEFEENFIRRYSLCFSRLAIEVMVLKEPVEIPMSPTFSHALQNILRDFE